MRTRTLYNFIQGTASRKEKEKVLAWIDSSESHKREYQELYSAYVAGLMADNRPAPAVANNTSTMVLKYAFACLCVAISILAFLRYSVPEKQMQVQCVCSPVGQQTKVDLSDGTVVWLNSNSSISFGDLIGQRVRKVSITGEAYFDVARDEKRPFIVSTPDFDVKVLGTSFNVNTYGPSKSVLLVKGSVRIQQNGARYDIVPGDCFSYDTNTGRKNVEKVDPDNFISWTNGYLEFTNMDLKSALTQLESFYGKKFDFDAQKAEKTIISGKLELREGIEVALENLKNSSIVKYRIDENKNIIITIR